MRFTKIPENTFKEIQLNAGILLNSFDPASPPTAAELVKALMGATSGGISFTAAPSFVDFGEDIDNCPKNTKELKKLNSWDIKMSGTFVTVTAENAKRLTAAADVKDGKITPRNDLADGDFEEVWWVGDYSDKNGDTAGGLIAVCMKNTLSTGGLSIKTGDKTKGNFAFEFTAHYSILEQDVVPFEVYVQAGEEETAAATVAETGEEGNA